MLYICTVVAVCNSGINNAMWGLTMTRKEHIKKYRETKTYIGDSVYIHFDGYHFILETRNGLPTDPTNTIALEPEIIKSLLMYREQVYKDAENFEPEKE